MCRSVQSCRDCKSKQSEQFEYIYFLMLYMPGFENGSAGIDELLPWSEFIREHCSGLIEVENVTSERIAILQAAGTAPHKVKAALQETKIIVGMLEKNIETRYNKLSDKCNLLKTVQTEEI